MSKPKIITSPSLMPKGYVKVWYRPGFLNRGRRRRGMRVQHGNQQIRWALKFSDTRFRLCNAQGMVLSNLRGQELWIDVTERDNIRVRPARMTKGGNLKLDRPRKKRKKAEPSPEVISTACQRCGADGDDPCTTSGGNPIKKIHGERGELAVPTMRGILAKDLASLSPEITDRVVFVAIPTTEVCELLSECGWDMSNKSGIVFESLGGKELRGHKAIINVRSVSGGTMIRPVVTQKGGE